MSRDMVDGIPYAYKSDNTRHDACIPLEQRQAAAAAMAAMRTGDSKKALTSWDELRNDYVTKDRLYVTRVTNEEESVKMWKENWSFLADFDAKGNPKPHPTLPETVSRFSTIVPNTNSANYGARVGTDMGHEINSLEAKLIGIRGKRKVDPEINCNY